MSDRNDASRSACISGPSPIRKNTGSLACLYSELSSAASQERSGESPSRPRDSRTQPSWAPLAARPRIACPNCLRRVAPVGGSGSSRTATGVACHWAICSASAAAKTAPAQYPSTAEISQPPSRRPPDQYLRYASADAGMSCPAAGCVTAQTSRGGSRIVTRSEKHASGRPTASKSTASTIPCPLPLLRRSHPAGMPISRGATLLGAVRRHFLDGVTERVKASCHVGVADGERRHELHDVAVAAGPLDQQSVRESPLTYGARDVRSMAYQSPYHAPATDTGDDGRVFGGHQPAFPL